MPARQNCNDSDIGRSPLAIKIELMPFLPTKCPTIGYFPGKNSLFTH